jgi:hypothetical protein
MSVLIPTESEEQIAFIQWFRRKYCTVRIFHIPNGGARSKRTAAKLKSEGVLRGVPDLFVPEWNLWIEMKRIRGGRLSPEQRDWKHYLEELGNTVFVAFGCQHAIEQVEEFLLDR